MAELGTGQWPEAWGRKNKARTTGALQEKLDPQVWFRLPQNYKFFRSLSITLIFRRMYGALNVGKKITNYTV